MLALEILYLLSVTLLAVYGVNSLLLTWLYRRNKDQVSNGQADDPVKPGLYDPHPYVSVQLPVYNERHVAERLLEAVVNLDWPTERLQIQVLDDSTDETAGIISACLERYRAQGLAVEIEHIRNVLASVGGNKVRAAGILGISRKTLRQKLTAAESKPR